MQDPEQLFTSEDRVCVSLSIGASRDLFTKTDIAYKIVYLAEISVTEAIERVIEDLQVDLRLHKKEISK